LQQNGINNNSLILITIISWDYQSRLSSIINVAQDGSANQKQELPVAAMFVNGLGRNEQFYRGHSIDASYLPSFSSKER
jgi:hypothetical protein